jgi:hypothetical protein
MATGGYSANWVKAGGAYVEIGTDNKPFDVGLDHAAKRLKAFGASAVAIGARLAGVGLGIGAGLVAAAVSFADAGSKLADMSQRTGDTAANLSAIGFAAQQSGSDIETLEGGLSKMSATIAGAIGGEKAAVKLLHDLGLSAAMLKGKLPTEQLAMFADKIAAIKDNSVKVDMTKAIFGKSGTQLLPLLNQGAAGIAELTAEARKLGLVMSDEDVAAADAFGDSIDRLKASVGAVVNRIGAQLAPILNRVADYLTTAAGKVSRFVAENQGLVMGAGIAAVALVGLGGALITVGAAATLAGVALTGLGVVVAVLTSPFTLVALAIGGALAALVHFTGIGRGLIDSLGLRFDKLLEKVKTVGVAIETALGTRKGVTNRNAVERNWDRMGLTEEQKQEKRQGLGWVIEDKAKAAVAETQQSISAMRPSFAANSRFSAGAASSIAGAVNAQRDIPAATLAAINKLVGLTEKLVKSGPVVVTEMS